MLSRRLLSCARAHTRAWLAVTMPGSRALTPAACVCHQTPCHVRHAAARSSAAAAHQRLTVPPARLAAAPAVCRARLAAQRCLSSAAGTTTPASEATAAAAGDASAPAGAQATAASSHKVVTFYCLTRVEDPHAEVEKHKAFCQRHDIKGRIYINEQGINAQLSGYGNDALAYAQWVTEEDPRFRGTRVSVYDSPTGHAFPRLTLRYKSGLVQLTGGTLHLPVLDPGARATKLKPEEWHAKLGGTSGAKPVVLDVRNGYEWDAGRFAGAERPPVESFRETVEAYSAPGGPLDGVPEDVPIMMYCTGGIRCDFYSAALRARGLKNKMFTLDGGVQAYLDACGPTKRPDSAWDGHLFVFDARLAMAGDKRASATVDAAEASASGLRCHCCSQPQAVAPHRNCPNVDCNRLFLVCPACVQSFGGFCCKECARATHVRPVLVQPGQRYARWSHYVDGVTPGSGPNNRRGEGRRLRKQRRKEKRAQEQYEMTVQAIAAAMAREAGLTPEEAASAAAQVVTSAAAPADEATDNTESGATLARRQRAARLAAAVANAPAGVLGDSRFAKMRARLREEAAARLATQLVTAQPENASSAAEVPSRS